MHQSTKTMWQLAGAVVLAGAVMILILSMISCRIAIPVDAQGQPTGADAQIGPSVGGGMEAVTVAPDGSETPIELEATPDPAAIAGAVGAAAKVLPPPWNLVGMLPSLLAFAGRKE